VDDVDLIEDEVTLFLKAIFLKAKTSGIGAEKARQIKAMLLSLSVWLGFCKNITLGTRYTSAITVLFIIMKV